MKQKNKKEKFVIILLGTLSTGLLAGEGMNRAGEGFFRVGYGSSIKNKDF